MRVLGNSDNKILFVGDSLIEHYYPWAEKVVKSENIEFYFLTAGGCSPIPETINGKNKCNNIDKFMRLINDENISSVVIGAYWYEYFIQNENQSYFNFEGIKLFTNSEKGKLIGIERLNSVVELLNEIDVKVNIILPTPVNSNFSLKDLVKQSLAFSREAQLPATFLHDLKMTSEIKSLLVGVSIKNKVNLIDPILSLCFKNICPLTAHDGRLFYKDNIHFRPFYVEENITYLNSILKY